MNRLKVILSESFNPHLNIGTEEWIFDHLDPSQQVLFLWRNEETVVIGRNQNPWSECNLGRMREDNVHLARRKSGGGAVFHDLGNTNFTFLSPKEGYSRGHNTEILLTALKQLGVEGEASGRNDLLVHFADGPRKFSGSAYREKRDRAFHHGTLLLNANISRLGNYLTPSPKKLKAKGKESVRARVANLTEVSPGISHDKVVSSLIGAFESFYGEKAVTEYLSLASLNSNLELKAKYDELSSWNWLYGHTLEFTHRMDEYLSLGFFDFQFLVEEGIIREAQVFTDSLYPTLSEELSADLKHQAYLGESVKAALRRAKAKYPEIAGGLSELEDWLLCEIEV